MIKNLYKITAITDTHGNRKESHRVGATGQFYLLADDVPCIFVYDTSDEDLTGKMMVTSRVQSYKVTEDIITVTTENSVYHFEEVK